MIEQRTEQWFQDRLGHATGSRASDILAGKDTQARKGYLTQLVTERLTGRAQDSFVNADMQRGIDVEPLARAAYQASYELTDDVGFVRHNYDELKILQLLFPNVKLDMGFGRSISQFYLT